MRGALFGFYVFFWLLFILLVLLDDKSDRNCGTGC